MDNGEPQSNNFRDAAWLTQHPAATYSVQVLYPSRYVVDLAHVCYSDVGDTCDWKTMSGGCWCCKAFVTHCKGQGLSGISAVSAYLLDSTHLAPAGRGWASKSAGQTPSFMEPRTDREEGEEGQEAGVAHPPAASGRLTSRSNSQAFDDG